MDRHIDTLPRKKMIDKKCNHIIGLNAGITPDSRSYFIDNQQFFKRAYSAIDYRHPTRLPLRGKSLYSKMTKKPIHGMRNNLL